MPISKLWKSEDWLAAWIGFIIISIGCVSFLTGAFDFSAAKFSTWHLWAKLIRTFAILAVLFTAGVKLQGGKIKEYLPAFAVLFVIAVIVRLVSAEFTLNRYLEWAFWALIIGLAISNTVGIGAYYYADIPGFEKIMNDEVYQTSVPLWVHIALFLGWGYLMWRLWIWIDKR